MPPIRLLPLLLLACGGPDEAVEPDPPTIADLPTAGCGAAPYDFLPTDAVGTVVSWERAPELDATAVVLRGILATGGYPVDKLPIEYDVKLYRMRYTTQDRGRTVEATALVSFPDARGSFPTVAWLHGTTGFDDACAPSAQGIEGAGFNLLLSSLGAVVIAPDYLGMNGFGAPSEQVHPYIVGEPTALASLDAVRAAWSAIDEEGLEAPERRTVLFGASEGGFAAFWADRYAPYYLPEADVIGVVASVPPTDLIGLSAHATTVLGPTTAALTAVLIAHHDWHGWTVPLTDVFTETIAETVPPLMADGCSAGDAFDPVDSLDDVFEPGTLGEDWADRDPWTCSLRESSPATATFPRIADTPVLYVYGGADTLVWHETNRADIPRLCEAGYDLEVIECADAEHGEAAGGSLHLQWQWVEARLAGETIGETCIIPDPIDCLAAD